MMPLTDEQIARLQAHYAGLKVAPSCSVANTFFREGVSLGERVSVTWSRVGRHVTIGENSQIAGATIGNGCRIGKRVRIEPGVELPAGITVPDDAHITHSPPGPSTWAAGSKDPDDTLPRREFIMEKLPLVQVHKHWLTARGDETLRLDYPLTSEDLVLDVGGFQGDWAAEIAHRFGPTLHVYEPVEEFARNLKERLGGLARVHAFGLAAQTREETITIAGESSSVHGGAPTGRQARVRLHAAADIFRDLPAEVVLMKINIEGAEYELLEHMAAENLLPRVKYLQIQFHDFVPHARDRRRAIRETLSKTHTCAWNYPFIWEGWERK